MVDWTMTYTALADYVTRNPEIEINQRVVSIPEQSRSKFYELFDAVRAAYIAEKLASQMTDTQTISQSYARIAGELAVRLGISNNIASAPVRQFLLDPVGELSKGLFDPLFQVLKGQLSLQAFEEEAIQGLKSKFDSLYQIAYEEWTALCLVQSLEPTALLQVHIKESVRLDNDVVGDRVFRLRYALTELQETKILSFDHEKHPSLTIPDVILYSDKMKCFVSLRRGFLQAVWTASNPIDAREWLPINRLASFPRSILVYTSQLPEDLALVADAEKMYRPDIFIECWTQAGLEYAQELKDSNTYLQPRLGTYLVSATMLPAPIAAIFAPPAVALAVVPEQIAATTTPAVDNAATAQEAIAICVLDVGFQPSKLTPILEALAKNPENNTSEALCPTP
jgi:hypothetical protein